LQKAAEDPPHGRVLLVEDQAATALQLQQLLSELRYRVAGPASSLSEVERLLERTPMHWPIQCALLDVRCADAASIAERLRARGAPVVWMVPHDVSAWVPAAAVDAPILHVPTERDALLAAIRTAGRQQPRPLCYPKAPPQEVWPRVFPQL